MCRIWFTILKNGSTGDACILYFLESYFSLHSKCFEFKPNVNYRVIHYKHATSDNWCVGNTRYKYTYVTLLFGTNTNMYVLRACLTLIYFALEYKSQHVSEDLKRYDLYSGKYGNLLVNCSVFPSVQSKTLDKAENNSALLTPSEQQSLMKSFICNESWLWELVWGNMSERCDGQQTSRNSYQQPNFTGLWHKAKRKAISAIIYAVYYYVIFILAVMQVVVRHEHIRNCL